MIKKNTEYQQLQLKQIAKEDKLRETITEESEKKYKDILDQKEREIMQLSIKNIERQREQ